MKKVLLLISLAAGLLISTQALADVVFLKDGGKLEGAVEEKTDKVIVKVREGMVVTVDIKDVLRIEKKKSAFEEYNEKLESIDENSSDAWYALGLWCKERGLATESDEAFGRALGINPDHDGAHLALGHKLVDGRWLNQDEINVTKGLVKYKGAWVTAERKKELEALESKKEWKRKVRRLADEIRSGKESERVVAENALLAIKDPTASAALIDLLDNTEPKIRILGCRALAQNPSPETFNALQKTALKSSSEELRTAATEALFKLEGHNAYVEFFRSYLYDESSDIRNRALDALVILKDKRSVGALIEILVVEVKETESTNGLESKGYIGGTQYNVSGYREVTDASGRKVKIPVMAKLGSGSEGSGGPRAEDIFNPMVREALIKITGVNFNFDQDKWRAWWKENHEKFDSRMRPVKAEEPAPAPEKK